MFADQSSLNTLACASYRIFV